MIQISKPSSSIGAIKFDPITRAIRIGSSNIQCTAILGNIASDPYTITTTIAVATDNISDPIDLGQIAGLINPMHGTNTWTCDVDPIIAVKGYSACNIDAVNGTRIAS